MERVNLLPDEVRFGLLERLLHAVDRHLALAVAGAVGGVVVFGGMGSIRQGMVLRHREARWEALKKEIQVLQVESKNQAAFIKQVDQTEADLQRQQKVIDVKLDYLERAKDRPRLWSALLKDLRRSIPNGVWLTELKTGPEGTLRIAGGSPDEGLVSQFMAALKESSHFSYVGFTYTQKDSVGMTPVVKFEIVCRVS